MRFGRRGFLNLAALGTALGAFVRPNNLVAQTGRPAPASGTTAGHPSSGGLSQGKSGFLTPGPSGGMTERADYKKVKIPYKERKGVTFPNGARLCVTFELAAEYWEAGAIGLSPATAQPLQTPLGPDWHTFSQTSWFTWELGLPRAMDIYDRYDFKATAIVTGLGTLYYPDVVKEMAQRGHEIATHGWDESVPATNLSREVERQSIRKEVQLIEKVTGVRPVGMVNMGAKASSDSLEFIANEGYLWHGDFRDDTIPYGIRYKGKTIVRIPHTNFTHNDPAFYGRYSATDYHLSPQKAFEYLKDSIDAQMEWAQHEASVMQIGMHPFMSCYPDRILAFDRTFAYLRSLKGIWFCTYKELAEYWLKTYLS